MKKLILIFLLLSISKLYSQEIVHWLINADSISDCSILDSGTFVHEISCNEIRDGYYIVFDGDTITEYLEGGKYYVKSVREYTSNCVYKATIIEVTKPEYFLEVGTIFYNEIITTATIDNLVKIKSTLNGNSITAVLKKTE
jgi:hypothetical protein